MDGILISFGELFIKSKPVQELFKRKLGNNIKQALARNKIKARLDYSHDKLFLKCEDKKVIDVLKNIPGISNICPCFVLKTNDPKKVIKFVEENYKDWIKKDETFAIRAKHDNSVKVSSQELGKNIGEVIDRRVNLSKPDKEIFVELRDQTYIYFEIIKGIDGLPSGASGEALSLMSAGIDSPVSSYLMLKRGLQLNYIHYHSVPATDNKSIIKSKDLCKLLLNYQPKSKLYLIPFYKIQMEIKMKIEPEYRIVLYRRFMLRIAEELAHKEKMKALVTGEALAQVSSQTIDNMCAIQDAIKMPVLRPLVGLNKEEIITIAKQIGSYETSIIPQGDCCTLFTPKHPTTRANLDKVKELEKELDIPALIKKALEDMEVIEFK
jgi:thiamine biosynthesis protein ThiI